MAHASLPVDVQKTDLAVFFAALALALASRREVVLAPAGDLHAAQAAVQLRRHCLREDARGLPRVFELVLQRVPAAVDLEAGGHVGAKSGREVQARKHRHWRLCLLHHELPLTIDRHLRVVAPWAGQVANLEVAALLPSGRHDAPHVEVCDLGALVQHCGQPLVQRPLRRGPLGCADSEGLAARILPAPAQGIAEVVGGAEGQLRERGETRLELLVGPNEPIASVGQALIGPVVVGAECREDDEERERRGAIAAARHDACAHTHGLRFLLGRVQLQAEDVQQAAAVLVAHDVDDVEEAILVVGRRPSNLQDISPGPSPGMRIDERQGWHVLPTHELRQPSVAAVPVGDVIAEGRALVRHLLPGLLEERAEVRGPPTQQLRPPPRPAFLGVRRRSRSLRAFPSAGIRRSVCRGLLALGLLRS
mmetsp:Transcript_138307/g.441989  ORF Transcript_138307/g.441989 Transcript_138307/m.441989 type:complete len:421 (-) Transcript_138307:316-1578(-)